MQSAIQLKSEMVRPEQYRVIKEFLIEWPMRLLVIRLVDSGKVWFLVYNEQTRKLLAASEDIEEALWAQELA